MFEHPCVLKHKLKTMPKTLGLSFIMIVGCILDTVLNLAGIA